MTQNTKQNNTIKYPSFIPGVGVGGVCIIFSITLSCRYNILTCDIVFDITCDNVFDSICDNVFDILTFLIL